MPPAQCNPSGPVMALPWHAIFQQLHMAIRRPPVTVTNAHLVEPTTVYSRSATGVPCATWKRLPKPRLSHALIIKLGKLPALHDDAHCLGLGASRKAHHLLVIHSCCIHCGREALAQACSTLGGYLDADEGITHPMTQGISHLGSTHSTCRALPGVSYHPGRPGLRHTMSHHATSGGH